MNKRQALKAATEKIEDQEKVIADLRFFNQKASADIKAYNKVIDGMIAGEGPCAWCEWEHDPVDGECKKAEHGKGCGDWMLKWEHGEKGEYDGTEGSHNGEGLLEAGGVCGTGVEGPSETT